MFLNRVTIGDKVILDILNRKHEMFLNSIKTRK